MKKESLKNLKPWKPGESGNPLGRPKGRKNLKTLYHEAFIKVAEALRLGKEPDKVKVALLIKGIRKAFDGNFPFYKDTLDRLFGRPQQPVEEDIEIDIKVEKDEDNKEEVKNNASTNNLPKKTA